MSSPDWRTKIGNLLEKAQGKGVTPEEANIYHEKAAFLMQKYGIEEAVARQKSAVKEEPIFEIFRSFPPYANRKSELMTVITTLLGGKIVLSGVSADGRMWVFAFKDDLERIKFLYHSLLAQMHIEMVSIAVPKEVNARTYKNSWLIGFIEGVGLKLQKAYNKVKDKTPGTALAVISRDKDVLKSMQNKFPNTRTKALSASNISGDGYRSGMDAGQRADVGQDRVGPVRRPRIAS